MPPATSEAIKKCGNYECDKLHRRNHENVKRLRRIIENITRFQSDPTGKVVNLSEKTFSKETFQLLNKYLNFNPTLKVYNKRNLNEEMKTFYRTIKLKGYFKDLNGNAVPTEKQVSKPTNHKNELPTKIIIRYQHILKLFKRN